MDRETEVQPDSGILFSAEKEIRLPWWHSGKESVSQCRRTGLIPSPGRSPGEGNGNPLQYCCLENPMDGGAWRATVHRVTKSWTRLRDFTFSLSAGIENGVPTEVTNSLAPCHRSPPGDWRYSHVHTCSWSSVKRPPRLRAIRSS